MTFRRVVTSLLVLSLSMCVAGLAGPALADESLPVDSVLPSPPVEVSSNPTPPDSGAPLDSGSEQAPPPDVETAMAVAVENVVDSLTAESSTELIDVVVGFEPSAITDPSNPNSPIAGMQVKDVYDAAFKGAALSATREQLSKLQTDPAVSFVNLDRPFTTLGSTSLWNLDRIDQAENTASGTYTPPSSGSGVRVYVVDTGVKANHPDFGQRVSAGYSTYGNTNDCDGHGTHVAGTIAGATYGVASGATIVPIRVFACRYTNESESIGALYDGLTYILDNDPRDGKSIVNMSLGTTIGRDTYLDWLVRQLVGIGIPVVVAAGNSSIDACERSPSGEPTAITVGATDNFDSRAWFSNWGPCVDLFAPGVDILSANYLETRTPFFGTYMEGTSMASPHVAGAIALFIQCGNSAMAGALEVINRATTGVVEDAASSPNKLLYVGPPAVETLSITDSSLPPAMENLSYFTTLKAEGASPPFAWSVVSGKLPNGLRISPSGEISGLVSPAKSSSMRWGASKSMAPYIAEISVRVCVSTGASSTSQITLKVVPSLVVKTSSLKDGKLGRPYSTNLALTGGTGPFTWSFTGNLPPGISFSDKGSINGVPTSKGTYRFVVTVTDAYGFASKQMSLKIKVK